MKAMQTLFLVLLTQATLLKQKLTFERPIYAGEAIYYDDEVKNGKANGYGTATKNSKIPAKAFQKTCQWVVVD